MLRSSLRILALAAPLTFGVRLAEAQMHHEPAVPGYEDCHLCDPWVVLDGAALWRTTPTLPSATADRTTPLVRVRLEIASFVPHVGLVTQMEFTPADGPSPVLTAGLKLWARARSSEWNVTGAVGVIDYRQGIGEVTPGASVVRGWSQIGLQYHTPLHELTAYAQAGVPFSGVKRVSYQVGLSHLIAPYKLHVGL